MSGFVRSRTTFVMRLTRVLLLACLISPCSAGTSPRGAKKDMSRALTAGVRSLNFDSDDEERDSLPAPLSSRGRGPFSDDEDERRAGSGSGTSSGISSELSARSFRQRRPNALQLSESDSDNDESRGSRARMSATSGVWHCIDAVCMLNGRRLCEFQLGSDSPSIDQSESDQSRLLFDQSFEREDGGTLVGLESPVGLKLAGGTPMLGLNSHRAKLYSRQGWKKPANRPDDVLAMVIEQPRGVLSAHGASFVHI